MNSCQAWLQNRPLHLDHTRNRQMGFQESSEHLFKLFEVTSASCNRCNLCLCLYALQTYFSVALRPELFVFTSVGTSVTCHHLLGAWCFCTADPFKSILRISLHFCRRAEACLIQEIVPSKPKVRTAF